MTRPLARNTHAIPLAAAMLMAALALPASAAPGLAQLRLLEVGKDSALLRIELTEPATAAVSWGEEPGAFAHHANAEAADTAHELRLTGLAPDRRYFYQVEADGALVGDMATFVSGRSWITRHAVLLVTAAAPAATPASAALADRLFAREADAIILLSGEGDASAFRAQQARAMTDRLVLTGASSAARTASIADVLIAFEPGADLDAGATQATACWRVACAPPGSAAFDMDRADVILRAADDGKPSSLQKKGERLIVSLAGTDHAALDFRAGKLTATLAGSPDSATASISRTCPVATSPAPIAHEDPFGEVELSLDGDAHDADCGLR